MKAMCTLLFAKWRLVLLYSGPCALLALGARILLENTVPDFNGFVDLPLAAVFLSSSLIICALLIQAVILDFKESERLTGIIATAVEGLAEAVEHGGRTQTDFAPAPHRRALLELMTHIVEMFARTRSEDDVLDSLTAISLGIGVELETARVGSPLIARTYALMQELRCSISRVQTIVRTSYIIEGYALVDFLAFFCSVLLIIGRYPNVETAWASLLFFVCIFAYLAAFIRALDNPFSYSPKSVAESLAVEEELFNVSTISTMYSRDGANIPLLLSREASVSGTPGVGIFAATDGAWKQLKRRPEVTTRAHQVSIAPVLHQLLRRRAAVARQISGGGGSA